VGDLLGPPPGSPGGGPAALAGRQLRRAMAPARTVANAVQAG
jgi:hypothetical protein